MISLTTFLIAGLLGVALTHIYIRTVRDRGIVAEENHRSMHKGSVVTGGGWPLLIASLLSAVLFWPSTMSNAILMSAVVGLALVSWADDVYTLPPAPRFAAHIGAAAAILYVVPGDAMIFRGLLDFWPDRLLAGFLLVWFINLFNFMDGIDGIAGVETISITAGYIIVTTAAQTPAPLMGLAIATAAATLGFLFWNWHPARIFLGDVGAVPLGLITGALMIDLAARTSLAAALILPLYFSTDATITLCRRILHGEKPWHAHREHYYQRATATIGSHGIVTSGILMCNIALIAAALVATIEPITGLILAALAVVGLLYWMHTNAVSAPSP